MRPNVRPAVACFFAVFWFVGAVCCARHHLDGVAAGLGVLAAVNAVLAWAAVRPVPARGRRR